MTNPWQIQTVQYDKTNAEGNIDTTGYGQISILLSKYVLKEKGKGLSSNDFTNNDVQKLNSIEVGAQVNNIETLSVNRGSPIYPDYNKNINVNVPTKTSQLENDSGFAKLINASEYEDYSDSYVGKSKVSFQDEVNIAIGKNSNADSGGIAIGENTSTSETYDINIGNILKHNVSTNMFEGKISESHLADIATTNTNGTNLNTLDTLITDLETETTNRINGDTTLQNNINTEITNRTNADGVLQNKIETEITNRTEADNDLQSSITLETTNRTNADTALRNSIDAINDVIPNQASSTNKLADKDFVNSSIQTNTANFRGSWSDWADVPTDSSLYPQDYAGNTTPTTNDYLVIENASDYTLETLVGTWRFKYTSSWAEDGKNGWIPEYQVNEEPFTSEQLYAINSGITSQKVTDYDNHLANTSNPHSVTASQVGLGNVTNVATESTITQDSSNNITSGAVYTAIQTEINNRNTAITNSINSLDVASVGGSGKYISAISETDGKISATESNISSSVTSGDNAPISSDAVYQALQNVGADIDVYTSMSDLQQDLPNINEGQFVATEDGDVFITTNTLRNGNMNPVTSNAVANALDYWSDTYEKPTGMTWIDGKPIYRCGPIHPTAWESSMTLNAWTSTNMTIPNGETLINAVCMRVNADNIAERIFQINLSIDKRDGTLNYYTTVDFTGTFYLILDYTKTTDQSIYS